MNAPVFTADWFSQNIPALTEVLAKFKGQPDIRTLEIGCFEGRGTLWLLNNILTDETSSIDCIDTFGGSAEHSDLNFPFHDVQQHFLHNIGANYRVATYKGKSDETLTRLRYNGYGCDYDIVYVDGSHMAVDVLSDLVLSWPLLKQGGIMFMDDFEWPGTDGIEIHRPKVAIEAFLRIFADQLKIVHQGYSVAVEKTAT